MVLLIINSEICINLLYRICALISFKNQKAVASGSYVLKFELYLLFFCCNNEKL